MGKNVEINRFRYRGQCGMDNKRNMYMPEYSTVQYSTAVEVGWDVSNSAEETLKENIIFMLSIVVLLT